jgi:hypothetical protein
MAVRRFLPGPTAPTGLGKTTDLDRLPDSGGHLRRPPERGVEVRGLDEVKPAEVLLRFHEGAVGDQNLAAAETDHSGGVRVVELAAE